MVDIKNSSALQTHCHIVVDAVNVDGHAAKYALDFVVVSFHCLVVLSSRRRRTRTATINSSRIAFCQLNYTAKVYVTRHPGCSQSDYGRLSIPNYHPDTLAGCGIDISSSSCNAFRYAGVLVPQSQRTFLLSVSGMCGARTHIFSLKAF